MPPIGWFMSTLLCILLIGVPYLWVVLCFSIYNGVFFKTAKRNAKLIRAEWSRSRRVLLLHFWDKRVCSRYRVWYVCYLLYLVHILLTVGTQLVLRTPSLSASALPAIFRAFALRQGFPQRMPRRSSPVLKTPWARSISRPICADFPHCRRSRLLSSI